MAKDIYYDLVKELLVADGWTITHDPLLLSFGIRKVYADLGAERVIAAEKGTERIAVEIKSFIGESAVDDLEQALGQYRIYLHLLQELDSDRTLVLAIPSNAYTEVFTDPFGELIRRNEKLNLLVFNPATKEIKQWLLAKD
jgi:hypothetical protein